MHDFDVGDIYLCLQYMCTMYTNMRKDAADDQTIVRQRRETRMQFVPYPGFDVGCVQAVPLYASGAWRPRSRSPHDSFTRALSPVLKAVSPRNAPGKMP
jgi:hypothetical protein